MSWRDLKNAIDNYDIINLPAQVIWMPFKVKIPSNKKIFGVKGSSILKLAGGNYGAILECDNVTNISIQGITFQGRQSSIYSISSSSVLADSASIRAKTNMGTGKRLVIKASNNIYLADIEFKNFNGAGLDHQTGETSPTYTSEIQAAGLWFYNCYIGLLIDLGEYSNYNTVAANTCLIGAYVNGANNTIANVNLSNCRVGLVLKESPASNGGHGGINSGSINHNNLHGIFVMDVKTGFNLSGLHIWTNGQNYIKKSFGIKFTNCHFSSSPYLEDGGVHSIVGCGFHADTKPTLYGTATYPVMTGNIAYWGSGSGVAVTNKNLNNSPPVQLSGVVTPVGSVTPNWIGQEYLDKVLNVWWKAKGITSSDWLQLN
jgi:hypothetical protein